MNKIETIRKTNSLLNGFTASDVEAVLSAYGDVIAEAMKTGDDVTMIGVGKVKCHVAAARTGRNPKTGETIQIPEKKFAKISMSKDFKEAINM